VWNKASQKGVRCWVFVLTSEAIFSNYNTIQESMNNKSMLNYYNYAPVTEILNKTAMWFQRTSVIQL